jgi:hypothetical protein
MGLVVLNKRLARHSGLSGQQRYDFNHALLSPQTSVALNPHQHLLGPLRDRGLQYRGCQRDIRKLPYRFKAGSHLFRPRLISLTPERLG